MIFIYNYRFTDIHVKISIDILLIYLIYQRNESTDISVFMDILILGLNGYVDRIIARLVVRGIHRLMDMIIMVVSLMLPRSLQSASFSWLL